VAVPQSSAKFNFASCIFWPELMHILREAALFHFMNKNHQGTNPVQFFNRRLGSFQLEVEPS
jgi:hypothetical protein